MAKGLAAAVAVAALTLGGTCRAAFTFDSTGSLQQFTITTTGIYSFTVAGAQGGNTNASGRGGLGTVLTGDVNLTAGTVLDIVVGVQGGLGVQGGPTIGAGGGGGGGSFIYIDGQGFLNNPLIVAGGGGGAGPDTNGGGNSVTTVGQPGGGGITAGGAGGLLGQGGGGGGLGSSNGAGGAGWFGDGGAGIGTNSGTGGLNGPLFTGGAGAAPVLGGTGGNGGYGGGGGAGEGGGGGGGYSGGGGGGSNPITTNGFAGGGGGSFFDPSFTNTSGLPNSQSGDGLVTIDTVTVPEPSSLVLFAIASVIGAAAAVRSRLRVQCEARTGGTREPMTLSRSVIKQS